MWFIRSSVEVVTQLVKDNSVAFILQLVSLFSLSALSFILVFFPELPKANRIKQFRLWFLKARWNKTDLCSKKEFLTIIHDVKTPLSAMLGFILLLKKTRLSKSQLNYVNLLYVNASSMNNLFYNFLKAERKDTVNQFVTQKKAVNLHMLLNEIQQMSALLTRKKGLTCENIMDEKTIPKFVEVDPLRLRQIFWNLIDNAIKFTSKGNITIVVQFLKQENLLKFEVRDTGIGIDDRVHNKIFQPRYQLHKHDQASESMSLGIGLSTVKRLAKQMGGGITIQSELGKGTVFTVTVKVKTLQKLVQQPERLTKNKVLLVEDSESNLLVSRVFLEAWCSHVCLARSGKEALDIFELNTYQFILLDLHLPDCTGFDVIAELHRTYKKELLPPLIALTAGVLKSPDHYVNGGFLAAFSKPLCINTVRTIRMLIVREQVNRILHCKKVDEPRKKFLLMISPEGVLDEALIVQYTTIAGVEPLEKSAQIFFNVQQNYFRSFERSIEERNWEHWKNTAHKLTGAAASLGLSIVVTLADWMQSTQPIDCEEAQVTLEILAIYCDYSILTLHNFLRKKVPRQTAGAR